MGALSSQVAVVTGAGSGIGQAVAKALAREGATTCLVGRTMSKLELTAASLANQPVPVIMPADLSSDEQMDALIDQLRVRVGEVDILVSCAGAISLGTLESSAVEELDRLYQINVRANFRLTRLLLPMIKKRPGQIVFINSSTGLHAPGNASQFAATQHALKAITDALRTEVNPDGIRVLSVYPGRVATPRQQLLYRNGGKDYLPGVLLQPEDIAAIVLSAITLPRTAEVTDISIRPLLKSY